MLLLKLRMNIDQNSKDKLRQPQVTKVKVLDQEMEILMLEQEVVLVAELEDLVLEEMET